MQPPIDPITSWTPIEHTTPVREQPLPYGQRLIVNNSGCAIEYWIRKCYWRIGQPNEYEAVTCGGDNIKFQCKDVIIDNFKPSHTAHIPHDYIVTITVTYAYKDHLHDCATYKRLTVAEKSKLLYNLEDKIHSFTDLWSNKKKCLK